RLQFRAQTGMSGANVSPIGRNNKVMPGANVSPIGRNKEEWFLSRTAITGGFRPRNHPACSLTLAGTPPNLGGEFRFNLDLQYEIPAYIGLARREDVKDPVAA